MPGTEIASMRCLQFRMKYAIRASRNIPNPQKTCMHSPATVRSAAGNSSQEYTNPANTIPWEVKWSMMTSSNGNIFRVTGLLCGEFTGHRWIPRTKASDAELWCFLWSALDKRLNKKRHRWFETQSRSLWRHCNVYLKSVWLTEKLTQKELAAKSWRIFVLTERGRFPR